ncbi:MAG: YciI family protein [Phenylobacterium sp.]
MKYLCLVYVEPQTMAGLSADERAALDRDSLAYDETLQTRGHYVLAAALRSVATAKTVRSRDGKVSSTDGPFAETKEVLGGVIFIEARDMDEAVAIAGDIPMARYGSIEVRPEFDFG